MKIKMATTRADSAVLVILMGFIALIGLPILMGVLGAAIAVLQEGVQSWRYTVKLDKLGWTDYERELEYWHLIGDQDFDAFKPTAPNTFLRARGLSDQSEFLITGDTELDELENKRFIAQVCIPAKRTLSADSAGWVQNVPTSEQELQLVRAEVEPYFTRQGLTVVKLGLVPRGLTVSGAGSYETLDVVVRAYFVFSVLYVH